MVSDQHCSVLTATRSLSSLPRDSNPPMGDTTEVQLRELEQLVPSSTPNSLLFSSETHNLRGTGQLIDTFFICGLTWRPNSGDAMREMRKEHKVFNRWSHVTYFDIVMFHCLGWTQSLRIMHIRANLKLLWWLLCCMLFYYNFWSWRDCSQDLLQFHSRVFNMQKLTCPKTSN